MDRLKPTTIALFCMLAVAGCKKTHDTDAAPQASSTSDTAEASEAKPEAPALPKADLNKPLTDYRELKGGEDVMFMYVAASKLPPDYDKLASAFSQEYRSTSDTFRKRDLLAAIKPQLDQGIADAKANPYHWVTLEDEKLDPYDFDRKGFALDEFDGGKRRYFTDYSFFYTWVNNQQVAFAPVQDEAIARALEADRTKWNAKPQLRVYFFAQSADLNANATNAYVTRVQVLDKSGKVMAEYGPDASKPAQPPKDPECGDPASCAAQDAAGF